MYNIIYIYIYIYICFEINIVGKLRFYTVASFGCSRVILVAPQLTSKPQTYQRRALTILQHFNLTQQQEYQWPKTLSIFLGSENTPFPNTDIAKCDK